MGNDTPDRQRSHALPLQGRVALVTGAGRNIGRAIALTLARDGATVIVNGRSDKQAVEAVVGEIAAAGGKAMAAMGDVSDPALSPRLAAEGEKLGGIDILVSNAGLRRQTSFLDMSFEEWREILAVALDGAFLLAKAVVPQMVAKGSGGAIVALSGISTHVGTPNRCHVSASKAGLEGLMRALAVELAPHRITCNALSPGPSIPCAAALPDRRRSAASTGRFRSSASARWTRSPPWCACWSGRKGPSSPARPSM